MTAAASRPALDPTFNDGTVYYARCGHLIKIGWTTGLRSRMQALRPDELVAIEPGSRHVETQRHREFAPYNVPHMGGREWFSRSPALLDHVAALTAAMPPPSLDSLPGAPEAARRVYPDHPTATDLECALTDLHIIADRLRDIADPAVRVAAAAATQGEFARIAERVAAVTRDTVVHLREVDGLTFAAIGKLLGFSQQRASQVYGTRRTPR